MKLPPFSSVSINMLSGLGRKLTLQNPPFFLVRTEPLPLSLQFSIFSTFVKSPPKPDTLAFPFFFHKNKSVAFVDFKQKILSKISGWRAKLLSQAARTSLIKTVANAIRSYSMSLFLRPKTFCNDIESNLRKFWWGCPLEKKHNLMLLGWKTISSPKSWGGLGIRPLESQTRSLLAKLGWNILYKKNLMWVTSLASKYL